MAFYLHELMQYVLVNCFDLHIFFHKLNNIPFGGRIIGLDDISDVLLISNYHHTIATPQQQGTLICL